MRKIAPGVFIEDKLGGLQLGVVVTGEGLLLIDSPIRAEQGREWVSSLSGHAEPGYLVLLDDHLDRALGARNFTVPVVAHDETCASMSKWSDTFKGGAHPIGAEADELKRITGVSKAVPELAFSERMTLHLGNRAIQFWHRPGPTSGSIWVVLPEDEVIFIGDAVTVREPPYLGAAQVEDWLRSLDDLRRSSLRSYRMLGSRDGSIEREDINAMARFLRKIPRRIEKVAQKGGPPEAMAQFAPELLQDFKVPSDRRERALLRLEVGLTRLYARLYPSET